ncbi:hypothetical protein KUDE01_025477 [Dissostichus eleginoides]|uniref:Uncharacterized protein n=1 Tax=Dissostichus eleginoides TaxID=100907 RepID=A0AAD9BBD2_DISEL|nr:hypothetical protein KUDE01_025477 [Dissostichus eleginoides]
MEKAKTKAKRKGGAEKLRARKKQALRADAAACVKITDMFSTGAGPSSAPVADIGGEEDDERERDQREWGEEENSRNRYYSFVLWIWAGLGLNARADLLSQSSPGLE